MLPRLLQLAGFLCVSWVLLRSLQGGGMLFEFGGLLLGSLVFFVGRRLEGDGSG